jgi:hypothetical protein
MSGPFLTVILTIIDSEDQARMNERIWWSFTKWIAGIVGYLTGSAILAVTGSVLIMQAIEGPGNDDSIGSGLLGIFIAGLLLALTLMSGLLLLVEIVYSRIEGNNRTCKPRLLLRLVLGTVSLGSLCWILVFWPPINYRTKFQSPFMEALIGCMAVLLFVLAVAIPFRLRRPSRVEGESAP